MWLVYTKKCSFMHWRAAMCVLGNSSENWGITCVGLLWWRECIAFETAPKTDAAQKKRLFYKAHEEREVHLHWSFIQTSSVVSCGGTQHDLLELSEGILLFCHWLHSENEHGTDRDAFTNLLTDFILIYEFLFFRTYSIFISYIYLF